MSTIYDHTNYDHHVSSSEIIVVDHTILDHLKKGFLKTTNSRIGGSTMFIDFRQKVASKFASKSLPKRSVSSCRFV